MGALVNAPAPTPETSPASLAELYVEYHGKAAAGALVRDLMRGDPATFKAGYSEANARLAAADFFGITADDVRRSIFALEEKRQERRRRGKSRSTNKRARSARRTNRKVASR